MITTLIIALIVLAILVLILLGFTASLQSQINAHERVFRLNHQSMDDIDRTLEIHQKHLDALSQDVLKLKR